MAVNFGMARMMSSMNIQISFLLCLSLQSAAEGILYFVLSICLWVHDCILKCKNVTSYKLLMGISQNLQLRCTRRL